MFGIYRSHDHDVDDTALALLGFLSDNDLEPAQFNTVFYQIKRNGPGGS
jgi:hypothetical protein